MPLARAVIGAGLRRRRRLPPTRLTSTPRDHAPEPRQVSKDMIAPMCAVVSGFAHRSDWFAYLAKARVLDSGWSHGVTVSTLDPESSDRGSNPRETFNRTIYSARCYRGTRLVHVDIVRRALVEDACSTAASAIV